MAISLLKQLLVLLWKHFVVRFRQYLKTTFEFCVPVGLFWLIAHFHTQLASEPHIVNQNVYEQDTSPMLSGYISHIYFAPNDTEFLNKLVFDSAKKITNTIPVVTGYQDEAELLRTVGKKLQNGTAGCAVIFQKTNNTRTLNYKIRLSAGFQTDRMYATQPGSGPHEYYGSMYNDFVSVQLAIDTTFVEMKSKEKISQKLWTQRYGYPPYLKDVIGYVKFSVLLPFITSCSFLVSLLILVSRLLSEKASGIRELMKMMGVDGTILWLSHYLNTIILNFIIVCVIIIIMKFGSLIKDTDTFILFICLFLYINYVTVLAFFLSTLFTNAMKASVFASILWLGSQIGCFIIISPDFMTRPSTLQIIGLSFIPNLPVFWMYEIIGSFEIPGSGVFWSNLFTVNPNSLNFSLGFVWTLLLLIILYLSILTWYIDKVNPGTYGIAKSLYFPLSMLNCSKKQISPGKDIISQVQEEDSRYFEKLFKNSNAGISLKNVWKVYGSLGQKKTTAVSGVTFDIYKDGVTVLLGQNGAGKTTLMSIITGMFAPTEGTILVNGLDMKYKMNEIRSTIGFCPQHNLVFSDLTVREHLIFFAMMKGCSKSVADAECNAILARLRLSEKSQELCFKLSGGMKRRVQLAIALAGNSSILILDEPTSGLDPENRRKLWDILLEIRNSHTILLTTHSMEEADALGDRVAIMDHGQLKCYGTPMFLKKVFGTGCKLQVLKSASARTDPITNLILESIPANVQTETPEVVVYELLSDDTSTYPQLFKSLEHNEKSLGIKSIGLSITTLEEVFLKVTTDAEALRNPTHNITVQPQLSSDTKQYEKLKGFAFLHSQIHGLIYKKFLYFKHIYILLLFQLVLAIGLFGISIINIKYSSDGVEEGPLTLIPAAYEIPDMKVVYSSDDPSSLQHLDKLARDMKVTLEYSNEDAHAAMYQKAEKNIEAYTSNMPIALALNTTVLNALYSLSTYHAYPISVNLMTNFLALTMIPGAEDVSGSLITVTNEPITRTPFTSNGNTRGLTDTFFWSTCVTYGTMVLVTIFLSYPLKERLLSSRSLIQMTGLRPLPYWITMLLFDASFCIIINTYTVLFICTFDPSGTFNFTVAGPLLLLLYLNTLAALSFVYIISLLIKQTTTGYILILAMTTILGNVMSEIAFLTQMFSEKTSVAMNILNLFPIFCFNVGLLRIGIAAQENAGCLLLKENVGKSDGICCGKHEETGKCYGLNNYFTDEMFGINSNLIILTGLLFLYMGILLLVEYKVLSRVWEYIMNRKFEPVSTLCDDDVMYEKEDVKAEISNRSENTSLVLGHLSKRYKTIPFKKGFAAVKDVSAIVRKGECFGLLGVNGAGKTTTFKMLVGEIPSSKGDCYTQQHSQSKNTANYLSTLGYCPQFDGLEDFLTCRQALTLFCRLRGIPAHAIQEKVQQMITEVGLGELTDVAFGKLSGGNKRKLSAGVALTAGPYDSHVVLLDEPTAGVDPHSRRVLHKLLQTANQQGCSIVLTSHSMDECEKLCSRLAIMSHGELACIGPIQHLKQKYGLGYCLTLKLKVGQDEEQDGGYDCVDSSGSASQGVLLSPVESISTLKDSLGAVFPCDLKDEHMTILQYHINNNDIKYSELFEKMEQVKDQHKQLEYYTITETTLEQVFLSFAKKGEKAVV